MIQFTLNDVEMKVYPTYSQADYHAFLDKKGLQTRCPHCKSKYHLKKHDWYPRHLYLSPDERRVIQMLRLKCISCQITFILLPPQVIPYKRYVMGTIYSVLKQLTTRSVYWLEKTRGFSAKLLRYWLRQYQDDHQLFLMLYRHLDSDLTQLYRTYWPGRRFMQLISAKQPLFFLF